jgi:CheY-like chemotaxis protein
MGRCVQTMARQRILVVEDEPATQFIVTDFLAGYGFDVVTAASGAEACNLLGGDPAIKAVFSDLCLPDMNGYQLAQWIRRNYPRMPIVFGSGGGLSPAFEGDFAFFLKPYDLGEVARHLHSIVSDPMRRKRA